MRLPLVRQYAPLFYGNTFEKVLGVGVTGKFLIVHHQSSNRRSLAINDHNRSQPAELWKSVFWQCECLMYPIISAGSIHHVMCFIFFGQNMHNDHISHDVREPLKQALLASRDVIISGKNRGLKLGRAFHIRWRMLAADNRIFCLSWSPSLTAGNQGTLQWT